MGWTKETWMQKEKERVINAIRGGPAEIQIAIDDYEARAENNYGAGESDWYSVHKGALNILYKAGGKQYKGRIEYLENAFKGGWNVLGYDEWKPYQVTETYKPPASQGEVPPGEGEDFYDPSEEVTATPKEDWREMQTPPNWLKSMASKEGGEMQLQFMAMENAMQGRAAAVDQLRAFDTEISDEIGQPVISAQDEQEMLAMSSGTLAKSYENQRLGATHAMGMRGIDPRSGVNQELMASMRYGALSEQARTDISTRLQNKQINRGSLERAIGLRTGIQGGIADLMAGQPLAATAMATSAAAMTSSANMADLAYNRTGGGGVSKFGKMMAMGQSQAQEGGQVAGVYGAAGGAMHGMLQGAVTY